MLRLPLGARALVAASILAGCVAPNAARSAADTQAVDAKGVPTEAFQVPAAPQVAPEPWSSNNAATLHVGPADNVPAIKDVITHAQKTLFIESFNFVDDSMGGPMIPLILDAAKRGVHVCVLVDYLDDRFLGGAQVQRKLSVPGIDFRWYMPRFVEQDNQRTGINITHRKLYLADGVRGLTGGVNLMAPFDTTTQDVLVDFRGVEAAQLHAEFARDWALAQGKPVAYEALEPGVTYGTVAAETLVTSPPEARFEAKDAIYRALEGAKARIDIEQQYLWDQGVTDRLLAACQRGVAVRIIVPGRMDKVFKWLHAVALNAILKAGGQVRLYQGSTPDGYVHTKYFGIDGNWAIFGSVNADTRALIDNQELDVATTDPGLIQGLRTRLFEVDWQQASVDYQLSESSWFQPRFDSLWDILDYYL